MKPENRIYLKMLLTVPEKKRSTEIRADIHELLSDYIKYLESCLAIEVTETQEE